VLVSQRAIQTLSGWGATRRSPERPDAGARPGASQISIKQLGTNGGGFFNVNSTMPFENRTQFSNFVELSSSS
jgi:K+-transporting ATPase ATPase A chain